MGLLKSKRFLFIQNYMQYIFDYRTFKKMSRNNPPRFSLSWNRRRPLLTEKTSDFGFDRHYVYHPAWAARILAETRPAKHVDISSSLIFNAVASAFVPIDFYEYRPADLHLSGFSAKHADITKLPFDDNSVESISCMHVIEHVGLGRYGDPLDPEGDVRAINELKRVVAVGGSILFVVPIGDDVIEFNAHRLYTIDQVKSLFSDLTLVQFAFVADDSTLGGLMVNPDEKTVIGAGRGCGCFWFKKG